VYGDEDTIDADVEDDEPIRAAETAVPSGSDSLVSGERADHSRVLNDDVFQEGKEDEDPNRIPSSPDFRNVYNFIQPAKANG
jgi:hypothetical protein